jgi:levansucrase
MTTSTWTAEHLRRLDAGHDTARHVIATISAADVVPLLPGVDFWDLWPVRALDGSAASVCGETIWAGLSAPATGDPGERHDQARIRLVAVAGNRWQDRGPLFADGTSAGSREWAGSLTYDQQAERLHAYYTAAGTKAEPRRTFRQRIMGASARVECRDSHFALTGWTAHRELISADGLRYQPADQTDGRPGFIKAFRDPFRFDDPATGDAFLLFTGSLAGAHSPDFNGLIGIAAASGTGPDGGPQGWELLDPLLTADGTNNELERPHVVHHGGSYYLFFSTQARTFEPTVHAPTGLYGFVGPSLLGPYEPLNGSGLVLRNPADEPFQAYSWLVLPDGSVSAFVDSFGLGGRHPDDLEREGPASVRAHFGGTLAPAAQLELDGDRAVLTTNAAPAD